MAIDAMVLAIVVLAVVLIDRHFVEGCEVALIDAQLAIELITRFDKTIADEGIDGLLSNAELVGLEVHPAIRAFGIDINGDFVALACSQERSPLGCVHPYHAVFRCSSKEFLLFAFKLGNVCCSG